MTTKQRSLGDVLQEFSQHRQLMREELGKVIVGQDEVIEQLFACLLYTSPSPRDLSTSRMPSSA